MAVPGIAIRVDAAKRSAVRWALDEGVRRRAIQDELFKLKQEHATMKVKKEQEVTRWRNQVMFLTGKPVSL